MTHAEARHRPAPATMPRWPLYGMAALALSALAITGFARGTGIGVTGVPESPAVAAIDLVFADREDGSATVSDASGRLLATLPVSTEGFVRGATRALVRDRKRLGLGPEIPFRLERRANGRLSLGDPATGGRIELDAFGPSNSGAFARFLPTPGGR
ncbi:photosynthetic complex assembly protein PuhC [Bosea sp. Leaf344]|uniref:photosynthetic complex assembly protein PuhC n=1 Tax=Bosea sp. Leaf344 TaxID=1736346 RepID=UPI0009E6DD74|nr:photosynthetic complex assembly protein PuhC [Bosea sp. Leaf344]